MESLEEKRLRKLQELGQDRPLVAGSLNRVERREAGGKTTAYYLLTFKESGKTRSVYVPQDLVKEVQSWIRHHRRVKQVVSEISTLSIAIIQRHVREKREATGPATQSAAGHEAAGRPGPGPANPSFISVVVGGAGRTDRTARRAALSDAAGRAVGDIDVRLPSQFVAPVGRGERRRGVS